MIEHRSKLLAVALGSGVGCSVAGIVDRGDFTALADKIESGADLNARDGRRRTPLGAAIETADVKMARTLLDAGADPDVLTNLGGEPSSLSNLSSPLVATIRMMAVRASLQQAEAHADLDIANLLIEHGADLDLGWEQSRTPLFESIECVVEHRSLNCHAAAKLLIEAGADVDTKCDGETPLDRVLRSDDLRFFTLEAELALRLIERGGEADLDLALERSFRRARALLTTTHATRQSVMRAEQVVLLEQARMRFLIQLGASTDAVCKETERMLIARGVELTELTYRGHDDENCALLSRIIDENPRQTGFASAQVDKVLGCVLTRLGERACQDLLESYAGEEVAGQGCAVLIESVMSGQAQQSTTLETVLSGISQDVIGDALPIVSFLVCVSQAD